MFYKEILEQTEPGNPFIEYLKKQTLEISPLGTNNSGAFAGLMCVPVCPKKLWISTATFTDIIKTATSFIKTTFKGSKRLKQ